VDLFGTQDQLIRKADRIKIFLKCGMGIADCGISERQRMEDGGWRMANARKSGKRKAESGGPKRQRMEDGGWKMANARKSGKRKAECRKDRGWKMEDGRWPTPGKAEKTE